MGFCRSFWTAYGRSWPVTKSILIQGYNSLFPVIAALIHAPTYQLFLFQNFHPDAAGAWGKAPPELGSFLSGAAKERVAGYLNRHTRRWETLFRQPQFAQQFQWNGRSLLHRIGPAFFQKVQETFAYQAELIEAFQALHHTHPLDLVVVANDVAPGTKTLTRVAQKWGVPVLHVEHASPGFAYPWARSLHADYLAVFGTRDRDLYQSWGVQGDRIRVTGCPSWDRYHGMTVDRAAARSRLGWPEGGPILLFCSTWVHRLSVVSDWSHVVAAFQAVIAACRETGVQLAVRSHPATPDGNAWHARIAQAAGVESLLFAPDLVDAMTACDGVFCFDSNAGIEAMLLDRPVVSLRFPPFRADLFSGDDAVWLATDAGEVREAVEAMVDGRLQQAVRERRSDSIFRFNGPSDGGATRRVVAWIDELVQRKGHSHADGRYVTV